jgi:hypothetical protein
MNLLACGIRHTKKNNIDTKLIKYQILNGEIEKSNKIYCHTFKGPTLCNISVTATSEIGAVVILVGNQDVQTCGGVLAGRLC